MLLGQLEKYILLGNIMGSVCVFGEGWESEKRNRFGTGFIKITNLETVIDSIKFGYVLIISLEICIS